MKCKICQKTIVGRKDKIFCSVRCKNYYHVNLRRATKNATVELDKILHRNRSILLEIMGKKRGHKKVKRIELEKKKFHFKYLTHFHINNSGKMYNYVYDFAWIAFSDDEVLIVRR